MSEKWTKEKLIKTAQAYDNAAQRAPRTLYSAKRRIAFTARKWARKKSND